MTSAPGIPASKRIFDIVISAVGILILSPLLILLVILITIFDGLPVLFCQERPGLGGKLFKLCKFRTMKVAVDPLVDVKLDGERITRLGYFLRRSSLDELPELFNVLIGKMSLVGPRPLLSKYLGLYSPEQARRHEMLPGITGWAQVNGRNALSWDEKFQLDVWYVDNWTFWLDIRILWMTIWEVVTGQGVSQPGSATMEEFTGNSGKKP